MVNNKRGEDSPKKNTAVLFSLQTPGISDADNKASLAELERLVTTMGLEVVATLTQRRSSQVSATVIGGGKLRELAAFTGGTGEVESRTRRDRQDTSDTQDDPDNVADEDDQENLEITKRAAVVVFDGELTPNQLQNLESATGVEVLDRTGVILEIFSRHAKSREARLQVEIAKLAYAAPRLRASRIGGDRQGGGIGAKGSGETSHELDKRRIRDRISELRSQLEDIHSEQENRRARRKENFQVALVGYTNAGKSSLMRALTGSEVYVADKLFATLDTRVRAMEPKTFPPVLVSDTVGFIKKLPHDLVASFRSTLDEALAASLLLFTVDSSDPAFRSQLAVTREVLGDIGATEVPSWLVLNKVDNLTQTERKALRAEFPEAKMISAHRKEDVASLRLAILEFFEADMEEAKVVIPYDKGKLIGELRERSRIIAESFDEDGTMIRFKAFPDTIGWIEKALGRSAKSEKSPRKVNK
jgi:GTP-binding protein HflX